MRDDDVLIQNIDVVDKCLSDHYVITFNINMSKPKAIKRYIKSRDLKKINYNDFSSDVKSTLPPSPILMTSTYSPLNSTDVYLILSTNMLLSNLVPSAVVDLLHGRTSLSSKPNKNGVEPSGSGEKPA